jgi:chemotaxis protein MotD
MMDALSAPRLPVSDGAASLSAGRADKAEEGGSFSKVLSSSGEHERGASREEHASEDTAGVGAEEDEPVAKAATRGIDRSLFAIDDALLAELEALPDDVSMGDLVRLLANAKAQGRGKGSAKEGEEPEVEIEGLDPALKAELAKAMAAFRDGKGTDGADEVSTEQAQPETTANEVAASDLADVLQLLAGGEGKTAEKGEDLVKGDKSGKDEQKMLGGVAVAAVSEEQADASASDEGKSGGDRDFRFVRADGKGQPVLLRNEGANQSEQTEPKAAETVTVVDSRRYIAPVSTSNAASITAAMLGDSEWIGAMSPGSELANAATQSSQGKVVHTLKIQMTPIELGSVTATLRLSGEELSVQLTVDNPAALRQLSNDQSDILKALRAQGLVVDQVQVNMQVASVDRSADTSQNGPQNQQSGQQAFQPGGQGGSERQQGGEAAGSGARVADERLVQSMDSPATDAGGSRPDQLYL